MSDNVITLFIFCLQEATNQFGKNICCFECNHSVPNNQYWPVWLQLCLQARPDCIRYSVYKGLSEGLPTPDIQPWRHKPQPGDPMMDCTAANFPQVLAKVVIGICMILPFINKALELSSLFLVDTKVLSDILVHTYAPERILKLLCFIFFKHPGWIHITSIINHLLYQCTYKYCTYT